MAKGTNLREEEAEIKRVVRLVLEERLRRRIWAWIWRSWRVVLEDLMREAKWVLRGSWDDDEP